MAKDLAPIPRFPLPDEWEPDGTRCVIVRIPDDAQYLATLTGLLDLLKWSDNFARDDTKTGAAVVCRTWQTALEIQPITWGDCEQVTLRQNPDNPCQLQQSSDGGDTWTLAFDYSLCADNITVPAPYPGSGTGASDAAAASVRNIFEALTNLVDCGGTREDYIATATTYLRAFDAGYANPIALGAIYDAFCPLSSGDKTLYKSDCPYGDHKDDLQACADVDGLYDWLNCAAATINSWLNDTSNDLMNALNSAAAALSGNGWQLASQGGGGGGSGFGDTCNNVFWWYFEGADHQYTLEHASVQSGGYSGNCVEADATPWFNGVNYTQGLHFKAVFTNAGTVSEFEGRYYATTTVGYTGLSVFVYDETDTLQWSNSGTGGDSTSWSLFGVGGLSLAVDAGWYVVYDVSNSDNVLGNLLGDVHKIDNVHITGTGIRFAD